MLPSTKHRVNLAYTHDELLKLFETAESEDVEKGGRYDRRGAAINVWSHHWANKATRRDSETMGTFYDWTDNCIYQIECDFDFSKDDLLAELATLERKALERVKHGMEPQQGRDR